MENGTPGPHCPGIGHDGAANIRMCVLGAEHDGECTDVRGESILGLTTAEMVEPDAERCPSTAPSDPTARCVRPVGHNGLHAPRAQLADGTVRWSDPMPDSGEVRCTVIAPGSDAQCAHPVGHAPLTVDGVTYDHHLPGVASWNNPPIAERCTATSPVSGHRCVGVAGHGPFIEPGDGERFDHAVPEPLPGSNGGVWWHDEPTPISRCESRPDPGGWGARQCLLPAGHGGNHREGDAEQREGVPVDDDAEAVRALVERALASGRVRISTNAGDGPTCRKHSAPVRARFVDLPPRREERTVLGVPATVSVPGGFALVVDRFRNSAHRDAEHEMWTAWGELIGAKTVLCYPGELEIADWYDAA